MFERFNRAYHRGWREMRAFLEENGVAHRMTAGDARLAEAVRRRVA
ncbi:MAG TPA: hypothetical protein VFY87_29655 [Geminicoccaceae bacterium]|nr:hypothetical protein [Geminicoccaceae bacterium]